MKIMARSLGGRAGKAHHGAECLTQIGCAHVGRLCYSGYMYFEARLEMEDKVQSAFSTMAIDDSIGEPPLSITASIAGILTFLAAVVATA